MEVNLIKIKKDKNYTCIDNGIFKDTKLSAKAKGVLCTILSLPDDWKYSIEGLTYLFNDGSTSIASALQELEKEGYLIRERIYENGKISSWKYTIYEVKQQIDLLEEGNLNQVDQGQLNTNNNKINNILSKDNILKENSPLFNTSKIIKPKKNLYDKCYSDIINYTQDEELQQKLIQYLQCRIKMKDIGKPLNYHQWTLLLQELTNLGKNKEEKIKIINQSIENNWAKFIAINKSINKSNVFGEQDKPTNQEMCDWNSVFNDPGTLTF